MKQKIWLSFCLLTISWLNSCSSPTQPPTVEVTPAPTPIASPSIQPSPIASLPSKPPSPRVSPAPTIKGTPRVELPIIYPTPTPVPIQLPPVVAKTKANQKDEPITKLNLPSDPARKITPQGIGVARIGMSFKELKQQAGMGVEFPVKPSLMDGFDAIAVTKAGAIQYYIPYPTGTKFTDEDRIQHLITDNPNYRTDKGVGPGTPITQAVSIYGGATLSLSKENESREFVSFSQNPNGIAFRPKPAKSRNFAGEYPESNEEYLKTQKYDTRAAIGQITVSCVDEKCGGKESESEGKESGVKSQESRVGSEELGAESQEPTAKNQEPPAVKNKQPDAGDDDGAAVKSLVDR